MNNETQTEHGDVIAAAVAAEPTKIVRSFETATCTRCGGTGSHSYCQMYGTTCFGCGGAGRKYTKRGQAAVDYFNSLRSKPLKDFVVGDFFYMDACFNIKGGWGKVTESAVDNLNPGYWHISSERGGYAGPENAVRKFGLGKAEKKALLEKAYDYQDSLTKQGTVSKSKGGK